MASTPLLGDLDELVDGDEATAGTDPGNFNTDADNHSDYSEVRMGGRRPLVPDLRVQVTFAGLEITKDGEEDDDAGDFRFGITTRGPDGKLPCAGIPLCDDPDDLSQKVLNSGDTAPYAISLSDCPT